MLVSLLPLKGINLASFEEIFEKHDDDRDFFMAEEFEFDHIFCVLNKNTNSRVLSEAYLTAIDRLDILHKDISNF